MVGRKKRRGSASSMSADRGLRISFAGRSSASPVKTVGTARPTEASLIPPLQALIILKQELAVVPLQPVRSIFRLTLAELHAVFSSASPFVVFFCFL